jgi:hypothetical protein
MLAMWIRGALLLSLLGQCFARVGAAEPAALKEYQVKAAFLYNFTKFVEWRADRFADTNAPIVLGVAGPSPCTAELSALVRGRRVNGRELIVRTVTLATRTTAHILFIPATEEPRLAEWLGDTAAAGILTVGESRTFLKRGGVINFLLEEEKVRFEIHMDHGAAAELRISAHLQKLARSIFKNSKP